MADVKNLLKTKGGKVGAALLAIGAGIAFFGQDDEQQTAPSQEDNGLSERHQAQLDAIFNNDPVTADTTNQTIARNRTNVDEILERNGLSQETLGQIDNIEFKPKTSGGSLHPAFALWANKFGDFGTDYGSFTEMAEANAMTVCAAESEDNLKGTNYDPGCKIIRSTEAGTPQCLTYSYQLKTEQVSAGPSVRARAVPHFITSVASEIPTKENKLAIEHWPDTRHIMCNVSADFKPTQ